VLHAKQLTFVFAHPNTTCVLLHLLHCTSKNLLFTFLLLIILLVNFIFDLKIINAALNLQIINSSVFHNQVCIKF